METIFAILSFLGLLQVGWTTKQLSTPKSPNPSALWDSNNHGNLPTGTSLLPLTWYPPGIWGRWAWIRRWGRIESLNMNQRILGRLYFLHKPRFQLDQSGKGKLTASLYILYLEVKHEAGPKRRCLAMLNRESLRSFGDFSWSWKDLKEEIRKELTDVGIDEWTYLDNFFKRFNKAAQCWCGDVNDIYRWYRMGPSR